MMFLKFMIFFPLSVFLSMIRVVRHIREQSLTDWEEQELDVG